MGPLDGVSVVGSVQFVGDQLEGENLFVDLDVRSGDVNLHLWIALLGCQPVANNLKKPAMRYLVFKEIVSLGRAQKDSIGLPCLNSILDLARSSSSLQLGLYHCPHQGSDTGLKATLSRSPSCPSPSP